MKSNSNVSDLAVEVATASREVADPPCPLILWSGLDEVGFVACGANTVRVQSAGSERAVNRALLRRAKPESFNTIKVSCTLLPVNQTKFRAASAQKRLNAPELSISTVL